MCDREALEPVSKVLKTKITAERRKKVVCAPHLFPPEGKGIWRVPKEARKRP